MAAAYITFTNLLTRRCSNSRGNNLFGCSMKSAEKRKRNPLLLTQTGIHSTREMGLKCQHLPRLSHIHQSLSPLWPCVGLPLVPLSAFVYSIFPSGIRHCRSERLNHPLPGEKLRFSQNPLSFTENSTVSTSQPRALPYFFNSKPKSVCSGYFYKQHILIYSQG